MKYKRTGNIGLFDKASALELMSDMGNPLEKLRNIIDFETFRSLLEEKLSKKDRKSNAVAKAFDYVLMFKILILQRYFGLGDKQVQYQIADRISFKEFLGLSSGDKVPDEKND